MTNETTTQTTVAQPSDKTLHLKAEYKAAREYLATRIEQNKVTRIRHKGTESAESLAAYKAALLQHKNALTAIKQVRAAYHASQLADYEALQA